MVRRTLEDRRSGRTDWARVDAMTEEEIEANALSDPDNVDLTEEELARAELVTPEDLLKTPISIRLDAEVLDYFRAQGPGYQTRINAVLRDFVEAQRQAKA